jgi:hypothetical protein
VSSHCGTALRAAAAAAAPGPAVTSTLSLARVAARGARAGGRGVDARARGPRTPAAGGARPSGPGASVARCSCCADTHNEKCTRTYHNDHLMTNVRLQRRLDSGDAGPIQVEMTPLQPTLLGLGQVREAFLDGGIWRYVVEAIIAVVSQLNPIIAAHQFVSACISVATRVLKHHTCSN